MSRQIQGTAGDPIEMRRDQWRRVLPDVNTMGMAILGRARLATLIARGPIEAVFGRHGVDTGEFDVLTTLLRSGRPHELRPTELYRSLMISSGGLTDRLSRLEKAGLIGRRPSESDARSLLVNLTPKGRELAEAAFREDMMVEARLLEGLSEKEAEQLAKLLARLVDEVEKRSGEVT